MITFARDHPEKFKFHAFVDEDDGSASIPKVAIGRLSENSLKKCISDEKQASSWWPNLFRKSPPPKDEGNRKVMFLVCGPEGLVFTPHPLDQTNTSSGWLMQSLDRSDATSRRVP